MVFPVENRISELYCRILQIRIRLGTKFHLKETILNFTTKFAQKGYFRSKTEKLNITLNL